MYDELSHHGILGQKWGIRRYQNPDGTLTAEGKIHYYKKETSRNTRKAVTNAARAGIAASLIGEATTGAQFTANIAGVAKTATKKIAETLGYNWVEAGAYGFEAAAQVSRALSGIGNFALGATTVVGLASAGFAVYRTAKAIKSGVEKNKAMKQYMNL